MQHAIVLDALDELPSVTEFGSAFLVAYIASYSLQARRQIKKETPKGAKALNTNLPGACHPRVRSLHGCTQIKCDTPDRGKRIWLPCCP